MKINFKKALELSDEPVDWEYLRNKMQNASIAYIQITENEIQELFGEDESLVEADTVTIIQGKSPDRISVALEHLGDSLSRSLDKYDNYIFYIAKPKDTPLKSRELNEIYKWAKEKCTILSKKFLLGFYQSEFGEMTIAMAVS